MRRAALLLALLSAASAKDILENGKIGKGAGWNHTGGAATTRFEVERGTLTIATTDPEDDAAHNWFTRFDVPPGAPYRLKLSLRRKVEGLGEEAEANVMVQVFPAQGNAVGYAWCAAGKPGNDWQEISAVFDVPKEAAYVRVLAYLVGGGKVYYDDFKVEKTEEPATPPPQPKARRVKDDPMWKLVRSAAEEIPWLFDAETARERAAKEKRPILLYVRCVDDPEGLESAQTSLRAEKISQHDDGLKKDVLFRAGPLSDPAVSELIRRRYVPLLLTYRLATHGVHGQELPAEGPDPLKAFGLKATGIVTPALVVVDGEVSRKLHRIGTMSVDLVDAWLRDGLEPSGATDPDEQLLDGDLDKAAAKEGLAKARALLRRGDLDEAERALPRKDSPEAALVRGRIALRRGKWSDAFAAFLDAGETDEARFYQAWCMHFVGKHAQAQEEWKAIAGPTTFGRKAAACLLPNGPRLWLAASERLWPRGRTLPEETEGYADAFDPVESVRALLELQTADGSFAGHDGVPGGGWNDGAITALACEALDLWRDRVPEGLGVEAARKRALDYLEMWARRDTGSAFCDAYVLTELVRTGRGGAAGAVVAHMAKTQLADGNWTVYQAERPASFNTALTILALVRAKEAGIAVPKEVLDRGVAALAAMRQKGDLFPYSTMKGHEWMTTEWASIARDPLCEHALLAAGKGDEGKLGRALGRFEKFGHELRVATKKLYDYFNARGHGGYYFFFAHRNAFEAAALADEGTRDRIRAFVREAVLKAREGDGTFMDHQMIGRAYATAQALAILAPR